MIADGWSEDGRGSAVTGPNEKTLWTSRKWKCYLSLLYLTMSFPRSIPMPQVKMYLPSLSGVNSMAVV